MKLEHVALNVPEPAAMAGWYGDHLGMRLALAVDEPPFMRFISDDGGTVLLELYRNEEAAIPDYRAMDPLILHLAFVSEDPEADRDRLVLAGATHVTEVRKADGTHLIMLRDPWGVAIQLCKRGAPLLWKN